MHQTLVITRARPKNATSRNKSERQQLQPFLHRTIWISGNPRLISNLSQHHLQQFQYEMPAWFRLHATTFWGWDRVAIPLASTSRVWESVSETFANHQRVANLSRERFITPCCQPWSKNDWWCHGVGGGGMWSLRKVWRKIKTCRDSYAASLSTQSSREVGVDLHQRNKLLCRSQSALHRPPQSCQIERLILPKIDIQASEKVRFDTQGLEAFERLRHCFVFSTWLTEDLRGTRSSRRCYFFKLNYLK